MTGLKRVLFAAQIMVKGVKFEELSIRLVICPLAERLDIEDILHSGAGVMFPAGKNALWRYMIRKPGIGHVGGTGRKEGIRAL